MSIDDYIRKFDVCQDTETVQSELRDKFEPKKKQSELLSDSYDRLGFSGKSDRVGECGSWLEFVRQSHNAQPAPRIHAGRVRVAPRLLVPLGNYIELISAVIGFARCALGADLTRFLVKYLR